jgi:hypothetical protein
MRAKLTPAFVARADLKPDLYWDTSLPGFGLKITGAGHKSYVVQYRAGRRSSRMTLKGVLSLSEARREAKAILGDVAKGGDPLAEKRKAAEADSATFRAIAESFLLREGPKLRGIDKRRKTLERLVFPVLGPRQIGEVRRSDVVKLLDRIEDENGPRMAHVTLAYVGRIFSWHAARDDDFRSPIVRGMGRVNTAERARSRVLDDAELRRVWAASEADDSPLARWCGSCC